MNIQIRIDPQGKSKNRLKRLNFDVDLETHAKFRAFCDSRGLKFTDVLRQIVVQLSEQVGGDGS